jgi:hypothetical protein
LIRSVAAAAFLVFLLLPIAARSQQPPADDPDRLPVPTDKGEIWEGESYLTQHFQREIARANSPTRQRDLSRRLLDESVKTALPPATRYVLFREARRWAIAAGRPDMAVHTVDRMGRVFDVDTLAMHVESLEQVAGKVRRTDGHRDVARHAIALARQAVDARRLPEARRLAQVAVAAAGRANDRRLNAEAIALQEEIEAIRPRKDDPPA